VAPLSVSFLRKIPTNVLRAAVLNDGALHGPGHLPVGERGVVDLHDGDECARSNVKITVTNLKIRIVADGKSMK